MAGLEGSNNAPDGDYPIKSGLPVVKTLLTGAKGSATPRASNSPPHTPTLPNTSRLVCHLCPSIACVCCLQPATALHGNIAVYVLLQCSRVLGSIQAYGVQRDLSKSNPEVAVCAALQHAHLSVWACVGVLVLVWSVSACHGLICCVLATVLGPLLHVLHACPLAFLLASLCAWLVPYLQPYCILLSCRASEHVTVHHNTHHTSP